jgi:hypothetical protein
MIGGVGGSAVADEEDVWSLLRESVGTAERGDRTAPTRLRELLSTHQLQLGSLVERLATQATEIDYYLGRTPVNQPHPEVAVDGDFMAMRAAALWLEITQLLDSYYQQQAETILAQTGLESRKALAAGKRSERRVTRAQRQLTDLERLV